MSLAMQRRWQEGFSAGTVNALYILKAAGAGVLAAEVVGSADRKSLLKAIELQGEQGEKLMQWLKSCGCL